MEVAGLVVAVALAVGGWIASGVLARRDARRTLRVEYLISAYRRLDAASNRSMSPEDEREIELATSDIQLFGSPATIALADDFVREFAEQRVAQTAPLLENLRRELRSELRLDDVPPRSVWLTIDRGAGWSSEAMAVRRHLAGAPAPPPATSGHLASEGLDQDVQRLVSRIAEVTREPVESRSLTDLAREARDRGSISPDTARAIEGLDVMRGLAEGRPVSVEQSTEFRQLVDAVLYTIPDRPSPQA